MNYLEKFNSLHTFIFDVDGVMTDNRIQLLESGEFIRTMNMRDGYAIKLAIQFGYRVAVITGGSSQGVQKRLRRLGVEHIFEGVEDKKTVYNEFVLHQDLDPAGILYMGDDLPDYEPMRLVGLPACPNDAAPEILELAQYISPKKGGDGCVRDVIEKTLRIHGRWMGVELI